MITGLKASALWNEYLQKEREWLKAMKARNKSLADNVAQEMATIGLDLLCAIEAQEEELSILKQQVEEFKPAFMLQQLRAGNFAEVKK